MSVWQLLVFVHVLGATVWTGGHLVLALVILPRALRLHDPVIVQDFEAGYERLAVPALVMQVVTGVWLAILARPSQLTWMDITVFPISHVALKLLLLVGVLALGHAKRRVLPELDAGTLRRYGMHVIAVTLLSVGLVALGVGLATGGYF
jgi:uncharacterized membrane protein